MCRLNNNKSEKQRRSIGALINVTPMAFDGGCGSVHKLFLACEKMDVLPYGIAPNYQTTVSNSINDCLSVFPTNTHTQQFSGNDALAPPWILDPCQLDGRPHREQVRLMEGHLRVLWLPSATPTRYTLIVTTLGKGYQCDANNMHPCLKIG